MLAKSEAPIDDRPKSARWLRFSLRTLLLAVLASAIVFAWFGARWRRAQRQAAVVNELRAMGVDVRYDYQVYTRGEGERGKSTIVPRWLRNALGEDFFSDVHVVRLGTIRPLRSWAAEEIRKARTPRTWSAGECRKTLALAATLRDIRWLIVESNVIRKRDLEQLTCWEEITDISFEACDLCDDDLEPLRRATNLQLLQLYNTAVTDRGMIHVGACRNLQILDLHETGVGDEGLREVANLNELSYLEMSETRVTDAGMKHLAALSQLKEAQFLGTAVTQAGIDQVPSLVKSGSYRLGMPSKSVKPDTDGTVAP